MKRNSWIALLVGLALACACVCVVAAAAGTFVAANTIFNNANRRGRPTVNATLSAPPTRVAPTPSSNTGRSTPVAPSQPTPRPQPTAQQGQPVGTPTTNLTSTTTTSPAKVDATTLNAALGSPLPKEDPAELAVRYKNIRADQTKPNCAASPNYDLGATRSFTLSNQDTNSQFQISAALKYKTDNVYMWVETTPTNLRLDEAKLKRAADTFQQKIYPTARAFFGNEANPGVDCDPHLYILHAAGIGRTVGGYFSSPDGFPRAVRSDSNEAEMFVINSAPGYGGSNPGTNEYLSTLAHEFEHMISHNRGHSPALFLEEGAAQLSERLNGYASGVGTAFEFASSPETQLNTWSESSAGENSAHYGAAYLFWSYLYDRLGPDLTQKLIRSPERSIPALMKALAEAGVVNPDTGKAYLFEDLFADFVVANFQGREALSDNGGAKNRFNYADIDVPPMTVHKRLSASAYPFNENTSVNQFGTNYYELKGNQPVAIEFNGAPTVALLPMDSAKGKFWWSNRSDESNPRLTREFDLTRVKNANLSYRAWYRNEKDFDYAYLSASTDGGKTWKTLPTSSCVTTNPNNANLGCGYTGASGVDKSDPSWVIESADLSEFAGKKVMLRFELVTDAGVNREGLAIDDIEIPEIGFKDDVSANSGWNAEGFVLADNALPQNWKVQLIVQLNDGTKVAQQMLLDGSKGSAQVNFGSAPQDVRSTILAISPTTLVTTEEGQYQLRIR